MDNYEPIDLGDRVSKADVFTLLRDEENKALLAAQAVIRTCPVEKAFQGDKTDQDWFDRNIKAQQALLYVRGLVNCTKNELLMEYKIKEGRLIDGMEFVKSREERISKMLLLDSSMADRSLTISKLEGISEYIDGLLWNLRDLLKLFK